MIKWKKEKLAVVDFETTGIDPLNDRIIEYGVVLFNQGFVEHVASGFVDPQIPIPEAATKVNGITNEMIKGAKTFYQLSDMLIKLLNGKIMVAYNAKFDRPFLHHEFARTDKNVKLISMWIDPLIWVRHLYKYEKSKKLTDMCKLLKIEIENAHRASDDAEAAGKLLYKLADKLPDDYDELIERQVVLKIQQEEDYRKWKEKQRAAN